MRLQLSSSQFRFVFRVVIASSFNSSSECVSSSIELDGGDGEGGVACSGGVDILNGIELSTFHIFRLLPVSGIIFGTQYDVRGDANMLAVVSIDEATESKSSEY